MSYIKQFLEIGKADAASVGGKAASLGEMLKADFPVPPGFVITTDAYRQLGEVDHRLPEEFIAEVLEAFDKLGVERVAVRSSAVAEDSSDASWAGQFESYLNVGRNELISNIKKCWESASSDPVKTYAARQKTEESQLAIAVVIQKMVNSEVAGVVFTINPVTNNHGEIMIEAVYALGELLVQGMVTPDNYVLDKGDLLVTQQSVATKNRMLTYRDGGTVEVEVEQVNQTEPCLSPDQLAELGRIVKNIEAHYGAPQDIEWALENGTFYVVQSRPITTLK